MINQKQFVQYILSIPPGTRIDKDVLEYLQKGINGYLYKGKTLDEALHFKQTRLRADWLKEERNRCLKLALKYCVHYKTASEAARLLEKDIIFFEATIWPKWKNLELPPEGKPTIYYYIFYAKMTGLKMPKFRQIIRELL